MKKQLTDFIIKITFGKLDPFKPATRAVIEELIYTAFSLGCWTGVATILITVLILFNI